MNNREREYALSAAEAFGTDHTYYEVKPEDYLYGFLEAISIAEEPLHHLQTVMMYLLFKDGLPETRDIVILGHGGDNIFGLDVRNSLYNSEKMGKRALLKLLSKKIFLNSLDFGSHCLGRGKRFVDSLRSLNRQSIPLYDPKSVIWSSVAYGKEDWVCRYFNAKRQKIIGNSYNTLKLFEDRSNYDLISIFCFLGAANVTSSI